MSEIDNLAKILSDRRFGSPEQAAQAILAAGYSKACPYVVTSKEGTSHCRLVAQGRPLEHERVWHNPPAPEGDV